MPATSWNDEEDAALQGLSADAQLIYLRGIRRYMNYQTRIAGIERKINLLSLKEVIEFIPDQKSNRDC